MIGTVDIDVDRRSCDAMISQSNIAWDCQAKLYNGLRRVDKIYAEQQVAIDGGE
jgi:hypothetical protein